MTNENYSRMDEMLRDLYGIDRAVQKVEENKIKLGKELGDIKMARVKIQKEIDIKGEELLIEVSIEMLNEIKVKVKEKEFRLEDVLYDIDKKIMWFQTKLKHIQDSKELLSIDEDGELA